MRYIKNITTENIEGVKFGNDKFDLPAGDINCLKDELAEYALEEFIGKVIEVDEKGKELNLPKEKEEVKEEIRKEGQKPEKRGRKRRK